MSVLDRRNFLSAAALTATAFASRRSWGMESIAGATLVVHSDKLLAQVPEDFTGLSYESSQLTHPGFFSATDTGLVPYFRTLGETGVLRIGGNMSEYTAWSRVDPVVGPANATGIEGPDPGRGTANVYTVTPKSIQNLNAFLVATNWKLIYGLNLARGSAESAADEAACVVEHCGARLIALQFGNEPDLFKHNGDAKDRWSYQDFITKWRSFQKAVHARVPNAPLAGPDTSFKPEWIRDFAKDTKGQTCLLTGHYYAEGPPTDPNMTIQRLLTNQAKFDDGILSAIQLASSAGMPYRMSEGNTCYNAGKKGVSDTFASALWAGDFLAQIAALGGTGVNLHGGGNGYYTPIAGSPTDGFIARPDYYGMLFVRPLFGSNMLQTDLDASGSNLTAYAAQKNGKFTVLAFNKSEKNTVLSIQITRHKTVSAQITRLTAPAIDAKSGVLLGGAPVAANGTWQPGPGETVPFTRGILHLSLPAYSAASASFA